MQKSKIDENKTLLANFHFHTGNGSYFRPETDVYCIYAKLEMKTQSCFTFKQNKTNTNTCCPGLLCFVIFSHERKRKKEKSEEQTNSS